MRVRIDSKACAGHGRCYSLAPELFAADDEGHGVVRVDEVGESLREQASIGVGNCPERAVRIE